MGSVTVCIGLSVLGCTGLNNTVRPAASDSGASDGDSEFERAPNVSVQRLYAIGAGETGCMPREMQNLEVLHERSGFNRERYVIWRFDCRDEGIVCSEAVRGGATHISCEEQLFAGEPYTPPPVAVAPGEPQPYTADATVEEKPGAEAPAVEAPAMNATASKAQPEPKPKPKAPPKPVGPKLQDAVGAYGPSFETCRGWATKEGAKVAGDVQVTYTFDDAGGTSELSFTETTPEGVGSCVRDTVDAVYVSASDLAGEPRRVTTTVTFEEDKVTVKTTSAE